MRDEFDITGNPVTLTGPAKQSFTVALETADYDSLTAILSVLAGAGSTATVRLLGSMSKDGEDGWVEILSFGAMTPPTAGTNLVVRTDKVLKYLRWEVTGNFTTLVFTVKGFVQGE